MFLREKVPRFRRNPRGEKTLFGVSRKPSPQTRGWVARVGGGKRGPEPGVPADPAGVRGDMRARTLPHTPLRRAKFREGGRARPSRKSPQGIFANTAGVCERVLLAESSRRGRLAPDKTDEHQKLRRGLCRRRSRRNLVGGTSVRIWRT